MKEQEKKSESTKTTAVQTGGFKGGLRTGRRLRLFMIIGLVVLALLGLWGYGVMRSLNPSVIEGVPYDDEALTGDYLTMGDGEIVYLLKKRTGLDANELRRQKITKDTVKNFYNGYEAARALNGLGDGAKALEAYAATEAHIAKEDSQKLQDFYLDYASVCLEQQKDAELKRVAERGKAIIDKSSLTPGEKADEKEKFEDLIWLAEQ